MMTLNEIKETLRGAQTPQVDAVLAFISGFAQELVNDALEEVEPEPHMDGAIALARIEANKAEARVLLNLLEDLRGLIRPGMETPPEE